MPYWYVELYIASIFCNRSYNQVFYGDSFFMIWINMSVYNKWTNIILFTTSVPSLCRMFMCFFANVSRFLKSDMKRWHRSCGIKHFHPLWVPLYLSGTVILFHFTSADSLYDHVLEQFCAVNLVRRKCFFFHILYCILHREKWITPPCAGRSMNRCIKPNVS